MYEQKSKIREPTEDTWDYFTETYGLDEQDEKLFEEELRQAVKKYGFTCYIHSEYVIRMLKTEAIL